MNPMKAHEIEKEVTTRQFMDICQLVCRCSEGNAIYFSWKRVAEEYIGDVPFLKRIFTSLDLRIRDVQRLVNYFSTKATEDLEKESIRSLIIHASEGAAEELLEINNVSVDYAELGIKQRTNKAQKRDSPERSNNLTKSQTQEESKDMQNLSLDLDSESSLSTSESTRKRIKLEEPREEHTHILKEDENSKRTMKESKKENSGDKYKVRKDWRQKAKDFRTLNQFSEANILDHLLVHGKLEALARVFDIELKDIYDLYEKAHCKLERLLYVLKENRTQIS